MLRNYSRFRSFSSIILELEFGTVKLRQCNKDQKQNTQFNSANEVVRSFKLTNNRISETKK